MRDYNLLLYRHGSRPVDKSKHEGTVAVDQSIRRWLWTFGVWAEACPSDLFIPEICQGH